MDPRFLIFAASLIREEKDFQSMENNLNPSLQLHPTSFVVVHRGRGQRIEINACSSKGETSTVLCTLLTIKGKIKKERNRFASPSKRGIFLSRNLLFSSIRLRNPLFRFTPPLTYTGRINYSSNEWILTDFSIRSV